MCIQSFRVALARTTAHDGCTRMTFGLFAGTALEHKCICLCISRHIGDGASMASSSYQRSSVRYCYRPEWLYRSISAYSGSSTCSTTSDRLIHSCLAETNPHYHICLVIALEDAIWNRTNAQASCFKVSAEKLFQNSDGRSKLTNLMAAMTPVRIQDRHARDLNTSYAHGVGSKAFVQRNQSRIASPVQRKGVVILCHRAWWRQG